MLSDQEFEKKFSAGDIQASDFDHMAHLRLAYIHVANYGEEIAVKNVSSQLKKFVVSVGADDKYHETLSVAGVKIIAHFYRETLPSSFQELVDKAPRLCSNFKELLSSHYTLKHLFSENARKHYVEPDLLPFHA